MSPATSKPSEMPSGLGHITEIQMISIAEDTLTEEEQAEIEDNVAEAFGIDDSEVQMSVEYVVKGNNI